MKYWIIIISLVMVACGSNVKGEEDILMKALNEGVPYAKLFYKGVTFASHPKYVENGEYILLNGAIDHSNQIIIYDRKKNLVKMRIQGEDYYTPIVSPNNKEIIFEDSGIKSQLHIIDIDGKKHNILKKRFMGYDTIFSQDGKEIYYSQETGRTKEGYVQLLAMDLTTLKERLLVTNKYNSIKAVMPFTDGSNLLALCNGTPTKLNLYDYSMIKYPEDGWEFIPNIAINYEMSNEFIANDLINETNVLFSYNLENKKFEILCRFPWGKFFGMSDFNYLPAEKKVLFSASYDISLSYSTNQLYEMNIDGTGLKPVIITEDMMRNAEVVVDLSKETK